MAPMRPARSTPCRWDNAWHSPVSTGLLSCKCAAHGAQTAMSIQTETCLDENRVVYTSPGIVWTKTEIVYTSAYMRNQYVNVLSGRRTGCLDEFSRQNLWPTGLSGQLDVICQLFLGGLAAVVSGLGGRPESETQLPAPTPEHRYVAKTQNRI